MHDSPSHIITIPAVLHFPYQYHMQDLLTNITPNPTQFIPIFHKTSNNQCFTTYTKSPLKIMKNLRLFCLSGGFLFTNHRIAAEWVREGGTIVTPLYHFHTFHKHSEIIWAITALRSPLHIVNIRILWF